MAITLGELATKLNAKLVGDANIVIEKIANLETAKEGEISFLSDPKYKSSLEVTKASAVIVKEEHLEHCKVAALVLPDPYVGFAYVAQLLDTTPKPAEGISPSAVISPTAKIGANVSIGGNAVIEDQVEIGDGAVIGANCFVGKNAKIGAGTKLWSNVSIYHNVQIGAECLIQSGTVIGSDGFGYANERGKWVKIPQLGTVIIGDHVEIGANTCIDRGAIDNTVIESNVIIDNLCQIAHNVHIGYGTAMAGAAVVAGSVTIGKYCVIGGRSVFNGHITICDGTTIAGATSVMRTITKPGVYSSGVPEMESTKWRKVMACLPMIDEIYKTARKAMRLMNGK